MLLAMEKKDEEAEESGKPEAGAEEFDEELWYEGDQTNAYNSSRLASKVASQLVV